MTLLAKCTCHHKNTSYFVNFTDNHTRSTLSTHYTFFFQKKIAWWKKENVPAFSPFATVFSKGSYHRDTHTQDHIHIVYS